MVIVIVVVVVVVVCFRPVSNRGPFACEANVITTTLRKLDTLHYLTLYS